MDKFLFAIICFFVSLSISHRAEAAARSGPYVYCNVYLSSVCFGISQGDSLTMRIPADFVLYEVRLASAATARIYVGYHPDIDDRDALAFTACSRMNGFQDCRRRQSRDGKIEMVAKAAKGKFIHVIVDGDEASPQIRSFLENIRACSEMHNAVTCDAD